MKKIFFTCLLSILSASSIAQVNNTNTATSQSNVQSINNTTNTVANNIASGNQSSSNTHQFGEQSYEIGLKKIEKNNSNKILLIKIVGSLLVGAIIISSALYLYTSRKHKNADGIMHE